MDALPSRAEGWDWPHASPPIREGCCRPINAESAARLRAALKEAGVEFLDNDTGEGVRLRVCNGATVDFTNGEPRDQSARNPSRAACSGCFEDAAASGGSANKKPGRFFRAPLPSPTSPSR